MVVAALLLTLPASSTILTARGGCARRPSFYSIRGGASDSLLWVKPPADNSGDGTLHLVRSLEAFCKEHGLDEDEMAAVAKGEADDHNGWTCGALKEHSSTKVKAKASGEDEVVEEAEEAEAAEAAATKGKKRSKAPVVTATEEVDEEEEDGDDSKAAAAADAKPPAPQMGKMIVGMVAPMVVLRVLKRFDQTSESYLAMLRLTFFAIIGLNTVVQLLLGLRIRMAADQTPVETPANPLAMLMGGGAGGGKQTACEYDQKQLKSLCTSYRVGCLFTCFLHFKMNMHQPLVYSMCSGVVDLFCACPLPPTHPPASASATPPPTAPHLPAAAPASAQ